MAIINRDGDVSESKEWVGWASNDGYAGPTFGPGYIATGVTVPFCGPIPYPFQIQSIQAYAIGMSGAPQLAFSIFRPLPNNGGNTVIALGVSNLVLVNGVTSLATGYSGLAAQNSTLLIGQKWDTLMFTTQGANSAVNSLVVNVVWKKTQDIVSHNGVSS